MLIRQSHYLAKFVPLSSVLQAWWRRSCDRLTLRALHGGSVSPARNETSGQTRQSVPPRYRLWVSYKIGAGIVGIIGLGLGCMLILDLGLVRVQDALHDIIETQQPISAAAYEMEINIIGVGVGVGMGVMKYLETGDQSHRARVEKDRADFVEFKVRYDALATTS